jgi:hypothetical protein
VEPKEIAVSTERDDNSAERDDDGLDGTAPGPGGHPEPGARPSAELPNRERDFGSAERPAAEHPTGEDLARRAHVGRIRRPRLTVAVVALAVLLAGGGGAYWAEATGGGSAGGPPPLRLDGPNAVAAVSGTGGTGTDGAAYQLTGTLPKGPDAAAVYAPAGGPTETQAQQLAELLGVTGPVRSDPGSWWFGPSGDGTGPAVLVSRTAPGTWTYSRYGSPAATAHPDAAVTGSDPGSSSTSAADTGSGTAPVSAQQAQAAAAPVLDGLGLSGARIDATQTVGAARVVTADPVVGGLPTHGWSTTVQVGADGKLAMAAGRLAALGKGDTYPVVSAATALDGLRAATGGSDNGASSCVVPVPKPEPSLPEPSLPEPSLAPDPQEPQGSSEPSAPQATPTVPGQDKALPSALPCVPGSGLPTEVRGAVFGLSMQFVAGEQTLVPSWLFDTAPGGVRQTAVVAQPAVDPAYIQTGGGSGPGTVAPGGPAPASPAAPVDPGGPMQPASPVPSSGPNAPALMKISGYQANGSTLSLVFSGGVCDTYQATADETGGQVRVRVTATPTDPGGVCVMLAKQFTLKVALDSPLGTRAVVDASDGQPVMGQ